MGDLLASERIRPIRGREAAGNPVPVFAKSGPVWKAEQPKEAAI
jgi:hypothetical protein